jgi:hypothetical protein
MRSCAKFGLEYLKEAESGEDAMTLRTLYRRAALLFFSASQATFAGQVTLPGTHLQFEPPVNFTILDQDELDSKFPSKSAPRHAVGNERRTTTIAYDLRDLKVDGQALARQLEAIGDTVSRAIPGHVSIERTIRTINGRQWAYFR